MSRFEDDPGVMQARAIKEAQEAHDAAMKFEGALFGPLPEQWASKGTTVDPDASVVSVFERMLEKAQATSTDAPPLTAKQRINPYINKLYNELSDKKKKPQEKQKQKQEQEQEQETPATSPMQRMNSTKTTKKPSSKGKKGKTPTRGKRRTGSRKK